VDAGIHKTSTNQTGKDPSVKTTPDAAIRACFLALTGLLLAVLAGCSTPKFPPAPAEAGAKDYSYVIGPGDNVNIIVWRNPELSMSVPVRPDGKITAPLVDESWRKARTR
jgi:polysaccharide biosynthesis/export protein